MLAKILKSAEIKSKIRDKEIMEMDKEIEEDPEEIEEKVQKKIKQIQTKDAFFTMEESNQPVQKQIV